MLQTLSDSHQAPEEIRSFTPSPNSSANASPFKPPTKESEDSESKAVVAELLQELLEKIISELNENVIVNEPTKSTPPSLLHPSTIREAEHQSPALVPPSHDPRTSTFQTTSLALGVMAVLAAFAYLRTKN